MSNDLMNSSDREMLAKFAALQALYKRLGEIVGTKDPDNLRGQVDDLLYELWQEHGVDRQRLMIGDTTVGYIVAKITKPKKKAVIYVNDADALAQEDEELVRAFAHHYPDMFAKFALEMTGAVPDGCEMAVEETREHWLCSSVTGCKPEEVFPLLGADGIAGYLKEA